MAGILRFGLVFLLVLGVGCTRAATPGQRVLLPDGRRLYLNCTGQGAPTVLLETGFAGDSGAWYKVQPVLAKSSRVCSYDRAGYGQSDAGAMPRDGRAVAQDLDQALRRAGINGPFILVGHSLGALYMRLFADLRPADVAGMVLADPSIEYQDQRFAAVFGPGAGSTEPLRARAERCLAAAQAGALPSSDPQLQPCMPDRKPETVKKALDPANWRTQISEADTMWGATSDEIRAGRQSYGDMPLIVLTADGTYANLPERSRQVVSDFWKKLHDETAARASHGSSRMVTQSSHLMMFDRPDAICGAVAEIISGTRK